MVTEPIICTGNELADTLRGLRERGLFPWALDTTVGTNARYRINYYALNQTVAGDGDSRGECKPKSVRRPDVVTANPATNNFERVAKSRDAQCPVLPCPAATPAAVTKQECGVKSPAALTPLPKTNETRSAVAGGEMRAEKPKSALDAPACISIEERMAALRDRLKSSGKLRRSKYSTPPEYARKPYAD